MRIEVYRKSVRAGAIRHRPMRVNFVRRGIDANDLLLCLAIDVEFPIVARDGIFELSTRIDRGNDGICLGIDDRQMPGLAINDEDVIADRVESYTIGIALCFNLLDQLKCLK